MRKSHLYVAIITAIVTIAAIVAFMVWCRRYLCRKAEEKRTSSAAG